MREVSHFLLELKNCSESRDVCDIPPSVPEHEVVAGTGAEPVLPAKPISLDPLQSASPETRVSILACRGRRRITHCRQVLFLMLFAFQLSP